MKELFALTLLLIFCLCINAQTPDWTWVKSAVGSEMDGGTDNFVDANGNVYVTGCFRSDSITFETTTLTNAGFWDIFVVKYNATGNLIWAKSAGGTKDDMGLSISVDASGNVYVTGHYRSPFINFGTITLTSTGYPNIFVTKYDSSGNVIWAKSVGGTHGDKGLSISADTSGNVFVTGQYSGPSITFGTTTLTNAGTPFTYDIFVVKYDSFGNVLWAKSLGGTKDDLGNGISTDAGGNVYVTGQFKSPSINFGTTILTCQNNYNFFIAKYDANGNAIWAKSEGGTALDFGLSISNDSVGNVYVIGTFSSDSITFGTNTLTNTDTNYSESFVVKYNTSGNVIWAKSAGGTSHDYGGDISTDPYGNVYTTGSFCSVSIIFDTITLTNANIINTDIFVVKYDSSGNVIWAKSIGGTDWDDYGGISTDASGNVFVTGQYSSPSINFGTASLTNTGDDDFFIAKLGSNVGMVAETNFVYVMNIFPNPFSYSTTIDADIFLKNARINVYNIQGQVVKQLTGISGKTITLFRDNLHCGLYFIRLIENNNVIASEKFVISD